MQGLTRLEGWPPPYAVTDHSAGNECACMQEMWAHVCRKWEGMHLEADNGLRVLLAKSIRFQITATHVMSGCAASASR